MLFPSPPLSSADITFAEQMLQIGREAHKGGWVVNRADHSGIMLTKLVDGSPVGHVTVLQRFAEDGSLSEPFEVSMCAVKRVDSMADVRRLVDEAVDELLTR